MIGFESLKGEEAEEVKEMVSNHSEIYEQS